MKKIFFILSLTFPLVSFCQPSPESVELAKIMPIADVHMHVNVKATSTLQLSYMKQLHVKWAGGVGDFSVDLQKEKGADYIAMLGQADFDRVFIRGPEALRNPAEFELLFIQAEAGFKSGSIKGFGEIHTDNHTSGPRNYSRKIPLYNPTLVRMFELANRYQGSVQVHAQMDDQFREDILRMTQEFPNATIILSHCLPKSKPSDLRELFDKRSNIMCELSAQGPIHGVAGFNEGRVYNKNIGPRVEWLSLVEDYPDRIMVGSDACCGLYDKYPDIIFSIRTDLLPYLKPTTAEKVAYKNAMRIFKLQ